MVDSGIKVDTTLTELFPRFEKRTNPNSLDFVLMKIQKPEGSKHDMVVFLESEEKGACATKYADDDLNGVPPVWHGFCEALKKHTVCFGAAYCDYKTKDKRAVDKLVFVYWCHGTAKVTDKMVYSATQKTIAKKIKSINSAIQCNDDDEIEYKEVVEKISKGDCSF